MDIISHSVFCACFARSPRHLAAVASQACGRKPAFGADELGIVFLFDCATMIDTQCPKLKVSMVYSVLNRALYLLADAILRRRRQQLNLGHIAL